jgi:hypothetical protein
LKRQEENENGIFFNTPVLHFTVTKVLLKDFGKENTSPYQKLSISFRFAAI